MPDGEMKSELLTANSEPLTGAPVEGQRPEGLLKLREKCAVYIDWANVYGWSKSLKREVDPKKLFVYLKSYLQIKKVNLYFGTNKHPKSKAFIGQAKNIGFQVTTKPVKYITVFEETTKKKFKFRKCDFDMETCIDVHRDLADGAESFVFFTGDGDFEPLYKLLIGKHKQVIVVYMYGHLGREIFKLKKGIFKISIETLERWYGKALTKK